MQVYLFTKRNQLKMLLSIAGAVLILAFSGSGNLLHAQKGPNRFSYLFLEGQAHGGFVINHHPEMRVLTNGYFPVWEFSVVNQTHGKSDCSYLRNYPQNGVTYRYTDFGGSELLGDAHMLIPFISFPIVRHPHAALDFRVGIGAAWVSKKFDPYQNYRNLAIGSHLNAAVGFQLNARWFVTSRTYLLTSAALTHISNGTIRTPNFGINIPTLSAGLGWKLNANEIDYLRPKEAITQRGRQHFRLQGSMAVRQIRRHWNEDFMVYIGTAVYSRFYNDVNQLLLAVDAVYDEATKYELERVDAPVDDIMDVMKIGVSLGHEWSFARLSLFMNIGYYVFNNLDSDALIFNKLGVNYEIAGHLFMGVTLQTHWAKAEFFSAGLGVKL